MARHGAGPANMSLLLQSPLSPDGFGGAPAPYPFRQWKASMGSQVVRHVQASRLFPLLWAFVACMVCVGGLARLGLWEAYAGAGRHVSQLWPALWQGMRYDLVVGAMSAWLIALLVAPLWLGKHRARSVRVARRLAIALLAAFVLAAVCEHFYFAFYKTRFDPIVFGLFEDDTGAVLETVWQDCPVVRAALVVAAVAAAAAWALPRLAGRLERVWPSLGWRWGQRALIVLQCVALLAAARGSVGTFPLVRRDVTVSSDPFVNSLVLNAPLTLYRALRVRAKEVEIGKDPLQGVHALGFASLDEAARAAGLPDGRPETIEAALFPVAAGQPRALASSPHVVLALLESFGADLLKTDRPGNDMLGRLRGELPHGYLLRNFIAGQNGTHPELENLLLGSPITPLTRGRNATIGFDTSAALPFKRAGYRTVLLYGGGADWRDIGKAFSHQGFDQVYDASDIRQRFPQAGATEWGVYDAYLFDYATDLLERADRRGERLFLFLLTTTNHPPYRLDTPHAGLPLDPSALGPRRTDDADELRRTLATYQYQADQFGAFLQHLRGSPLVERTVVAAAGDHNLRTHYRYALPMQQPDVDRVFAYLRVPPAFAAGRAPDPTAYCGHADLVPTLATLAVPGQRYFATGRDLLAPAPDGGQALAQFDRLYTRQAVMFPLAAPLAYPWRDGGELARAGRPPAAEERDRARRAAAWTALRDWHLRRAVLAARNGRMSVS